MHRIHLGGICDFVMSCPADSLDLGLETLVTKGSALSVWRMYHELTHLRWRAVYIKYE